MARLLVQMLLVCVIAAGCGKKIPKDKVTYVADDDPAMNAAIDKARSTVSEFTAALKSPKTGQSQFSVKMGVNDGKHTEHMWLTDVSFDGKKFHGKIANVPESVSNIKMGDKANVETSQISDWMFVENRKLVGGYTLRVLRDTLSPKEREEFDKSVPFVID